MTVLVRWMQGITINLSIEWNSNNWFAWSSKPIHLRIGMFLYLISPIITCYMHGIHLTNKRWLRSKEDLSNVYFACTIDLNCCSVDCSLRYCLGTNERLIGGCHMSMKLRNRRVTKRKLAYTGNTRGKNRKQSPPDSNMCICEQII